MSEESYKGLPESSLDKARRVAGGFREELASYQTERGEAVNTTISWLDAFNNRAAILAVGIPRKHPANALLKDIIVRTHEFTEDNIQQKDKDDLLLMIDQLSEKLNQ